MRNRPLVLIVDDDVDTREMYAWSLEARGFDVVSAATAAKGGELADRARPEVVVTDFMLPGADGFALASRIRATDAVADTPLILVSGRAFVGTSGERAMELFDRVLLKPVLPDQLIENIVPLLLDRAAAQLQRQLRDVRSRLQGVPHTSDSGRVLTAVTELSADGEAPAALIADTAAHYIAANDAACALTGRTREELLSLSVWDLTPHASVADGRKAWAQFVETGTLSGAYVLRTPSGGEIEARFASSAHVLPDCHLSLLRSVPPALLRGDAR
jgi:DNA-binding response OmpR family regulator